jgi:hypothetical protein
MQLVLAARSKHPVDKGARNAAGSLLVGYACLYDRRRRRY